MQHPFLQALSLGLCAVAAISASPAMAGNFVYTTIDAPGATATYPVSINDRGEVAGVYSTTSTGPQYGFVASNGTVTTFHAFDPKRSLGVAGIDYTGAVAFSTGGADTARVRHPGGAVSHIQFPASVSGYPAGINGRGQIVGATEPGLSGQARSGFQYYKGQLATVAFPGASITTPAAIGKTGIVVGSYAASDIDPAHGFMLQNGTYTSFDPPNSRYTIVHSINPAGDIAGTFYTPDLGTGTLGFVLSAGTYHVFAMQRGKEYVNEVVWAGSADHVAGNFYNLFNEIGFTHSNGHYYQVLPFGAANSYIYGGNTQGTLVGIYYGTDGITHGFVAVCPAGQAPCTN